jgi:hypothetical protein
LLRRKKRIERPKPVIAPIRSGQLHKGNAMRIYVFKSETNKLRAFAGDVGGDKLPEQFRPWHAVGVIRDGDDPPYKLSRDEIEKAIDDQGFQLWRMKPKGMAK